MAKNVLVGLVTAWRLAGRPTRRSSSAVNATIGGRRVGALGILQNLRLSAFHDGDARVGRAEVDTDNFSHSRQSFSVAADRVDPVWHPTCPPTRGSKHRSPGFQLCDRRLYKELFSACNGFSRAGQSTLKPSRCGTASTDHCHEYAFDFGPCITELHQFPNASRRAESPSPLDSSRKEVAAYAKPKTMSRATRARKSKLRTGVLRSAMLRLAAFGPPFETTTIAGRKQRSSSS